jgi:hypothetical protein
MRLWFFVGFTSGDELGYYHFAYDALKGQLNHSANFHATRIGIIYPTALSYVFFGVNEFSANFLPFLAGMLSVVLVFFLGRMFFGDKTGLIAAFLMAIYPVQVFYSTVLYPDLPSAFLVGLSVFLFFISEKKTSNILLFCTGVLVGLGYLMKELSVIIFIFLVAYLIYKKRLRLRHSLILVGFIVVLFLEMGYYLATEDNPLYRYTEVQEGGSAYMKLFYPNYFGEKMLVRLFFHYPYVLWNDILARSFYVLFLIAVVYMLIKRKENSYPFMLWSAIGFLFMNFGSTSLSEYLPLPVSTRYIEMITIPLIIVSAYFLSQRAIAKKEVLLGGVMVALFMSSLHALSVDERINLTTNARFAHASLTSLPPKDVYADFRTAEMLKFLFKYERNDMIHYYNNYIVSYNFVAERNVLLNMEGVHDAYVIIDNKMKRALSESIKELKFPPEIENIPEQWILLKKFGDDKSEEISIYYVA